jgi:alkyl sulfatase BDS1-like metallo-beta-lactamase superfamily hydrolase
VSVTIPKSTLADIMTQETTFVKEVESGTVGLEGDPSALVTIFGNLDVFVADWPIVEP